MTVTPHAARERLSESGSRSASRLPRLGFLGVGWIGRTRLDAVANGGAGMVAAVADQDRAVAEHVAQSHEGAFRAAGLEELCAMDLDGIVIATPSALHAEQTISALRAGKAVFCQKPLARTAAETRTAITVARETNRLLGVDLSYRYCRGIQEIRKLVQNNDLGDVFGVDLVFHNAYGPDSSWFYDMRKSGGGCVIDLGVHLIDLLLWLTGFQSITGIHSRLYAGGALVNKSATVEDYGLAHIDLNGGISARLACSWRLHAGQDAVIEVSVYGSRGGARMRNVNGSFYDFVTEQYAGTSCMTLAAPPDAWGERAIIAWAEQLAVSPAYDPEIEQINKVATVIDLIYSR